jgi:hypothetical protein
VVDRWVIYALEAFFALDLFLGLLVALVCWLRPAKKSTLEVGSPDSLERNFLEGRITATEFWFLMDATKGRTTHQKGPLT